MATLFLNITTRINMELDEKTRMTTFIKAKLNKSNKGLINMKY